MTAMRDEGIVENAGRIGRDVLGPGLRELADAAPERRRGPGPRRHVGGRARPRPRTREPLVPYAATGPANAPMVELGRALLQGGVLPLTAGNRLHVVPPCTITEAEVKDGLAVLDDALATTDAYVSS